MAYTYNPSYSGGRDQGIAVQSQPRQKVHKTLSQKHPSQKRAVKWLKMYTLSSNPSIAKKKKKKFQGKFQIFSKS
jgi:hypothetical protein